MVDHLPRRNINGRLTNLNYAPRDGTLLFRPIFLTNPNTIKNELTRHAPWQDRTMNIRGNILPVPRLTSYYGQQTGEHTSNCILYNPIDWTRPLAEFKNIIELESSGSQLQEQYTNVLLEYYRNGNDCMKIDSENFTDLGENPITATVFLSAQGPIRRRICFKHVQTKEIFQIKIEHNSLIIMGNGFHKNWRQYIPKEKINKEHISLTFKKIVR